MPSRALLVFLLFQPLTVLAASWERPAIDYVLENDSALRKELGRGRGESWRTLCDLLRKSDLQCARLGASVIREGKKLISATDERDFYLRLRALDVGTENGALAEF